MLRHWPSATRLLFIALLFAACSAPNAAQNSDGGRRLTVATARPGQVTPQPAAQVVARNVTSRTTANLRAGPGTSFPILGAAQPGQMLRATGQNAEGDWLQLEDGHWIFGDLVTEVSDVPGNRLNPAGIAASDTMTVTFINVALGDSILIQAPGGHNALIDGGLPGFGPLPYLQAHGITSLDLVVATHPHIDHIGGLPDVLHALPVERVVTNGQSLATDDYRALREAITASKARYGEVKRGDKMTLGRLQLEVLSPSRVKPPGDPNHNSLVLRLAYGETSFQFEADADLATEEAMQAARLLQPATVLKMGHHGGAESTGAAFARAVRPKLAVYQTMFANPFGYPAEEASANLKEVGAEVHGTDREGTIVITCDGQNCQVR